MWNAAQWNAAWQAKADYPLKGAPLTVNTQSGSYTAVLNDGNAAVIMTGSGTTFTVPANASVAYTPVTIITVINASGGNQSIAINSDSLTLVASSTTGTRTLAANGIATIVKYANTNWLIGGPGVT